MALEFEHKIRRVLDSWLAAGKVLVKHIDNLRYGRETEIEESYRNWRLLYEYILAYDNQLACKKSPFNLVINGLYITHDLSILGMVSESQETITCPCETRCLNDLEISTLEEKIVEITKTCEN